MKKNILKHIYGAFMLPILFAATSCSNDPIEPSQPTNPAQGKEMTLKVSMEENKKPNARVSYQDENVGIGNTLLWEKDDKIKVVGMDGSICKGVREFRLKSGEGTKDAEFRGEVIPGAKTYKIYYPSTVEIDETNGSATLNIDVQKQSGDNKTDLLKNYIFLEGERHAGTANATRLTMKSSIMKFEIVEVPKEVGKLKSLIFAVAKKSGDDENPLLDYRYVQKLDFDGNKVKFDDTKTTLTAYLSFMPEKLKLEGQGYTAHIILLGDKNYQSVLPIYEGKTYKSGYRYKIPASLIYKFRSPLEYAAERNLAPVENGEYKPENAKFASSDANDVSGFFTRQQTENIFDITNRTSIKIDNEDYVYPDKNQWFSIIPEELKSEHDFLLAFAKQYTLKNHEEEVKVGKIRFKTKNDYKGTENLVVYALRFKDNINLWRTAWRYSIVENEEEYTILAGNKPKKNKCLVIETIYLGPFDTTTIDDIAKESFWEGKEKVKRIFPFSDQRFAGFNPSNPTAVQNIGSTGYWWVKDKKWNVYVHEDNGYTIMKPSFSDSNELTVRPFYYDIFYL